MPAPDRHITARDIILEIVHNMREGIEPMLYSSLAPAVYQVFVHADDFERLCPVAARLVDEARRALDEDVDELNGGSPIVPWTKPPTHCVLSDFTRRPSAAGRAATIRSGSCA